MSKKRNQISTIGQWIVTLVTLTSLLFSQTWEDLGLKGERVITIKCHPNNPDVIFAGTYQGSLYQTTDPGFLYRSTDAGQNWTPILSNFKTIDVSINPIDTSVILVAGRGTTTSHIILKSSEDGANWQASQNGVTVTETIYASFISLCPTNPDTVYTGTAIMSLTPNCSAYRSTDGGTNWTRMNFSPGNAYCIAFDPDDPNTIYIGGSQLYKSSDAGQTWKKAYDFKSAILCIAINPTDHDEIYIASMSKGIYKSINGGVSWTAKNSGLPTKETSSIRVNPDNPAQVFTTVTEKGVFISYDKAGNWQAINNGLTNKEVLFLHLDSIRKRLYCGTKDGLYRLQLNPDHVTGQIPDVPRHLQLLAPYPNPFNASLTIPFTLNYPANHIRLEIFDLNGKNIKSLTADGLPAGYQRFLWNGFDQSGATAPTGLYYYRLICDDRPAGLGKVILLK